MKLDLIDDGSALIKTNEGLLYYTLNMCNCAYSDEAKSVAYEALWRAIQTFDEERGVLFSTYAVTCMKNAIYDVLRKKKEQQDAEVSLEDVEYLCTYEEAYLPDLEPTQDYTKLHKAVDDALNRLTGKKHKIAELWLSSNMSVTALAAEVPCSQSYASQTIAEFKATLRKDLTDAGYCRDDSVD